MHQRKDGIAHVVGLGLELCEIELVGAGERSDLASGVAGNHTATRLRLRECDLNLDAALEKSLVGEHRAHRRRAEGIAVQ